MKHTVMVIIILLGVVVHLDAKKNYWAVVGAGPAGVSTIIQLLKNNIPPKHIIWIDPKFNGGRLEQFTHVPSNTQVKGFLNYFKQCSTLCNHEFVTPKTPLKKRNITSWCPLGHIHEPLVHVSDHLRSLVKTVVGSVTSLVRKKEVWTLETDIEKIIEAYKVVLATGSQPRSLDYTGNFTTLPLEDAFDSKKLQPHITTNDTVAVFGNSHSAILAVKNLYLLEKKPEQIINFYKTPLRFFHRKKGKVHYRYSGLKAGTGRWAKQVLLKEKPDRITCLESTDANIKKLLPHCTKVIYGVGYKRNNLPALEENPEYSYDNTTGTIARNLFGIGIAFPEKYIDPSGFPEHRVGLLSFMRYAKRVVPLWIKS